MNSIHPLQLPEIVSKVANFVQEHGRPSCLRVSKAWYHVFIRLIWEDINAQRQKQSVETLQSHAHLVKTLKLGHEYATYGTLVFPNLESLTLGGGPTQQYQEFMSHHPRLVSLDIGVGAIVEDGLWGTLWTRFARLKELTFWDVEVGEAEVNGFWQVCTRLEVLSIHGVKVLHPGQLSVMEFPCLKKLSVTKFFENPVPVILDFMIKCPNLTDFHWNDGPKSMRGFIGFYDLMAVKTWPHLRTLSLPWCIANDEVILKLFAGIQQAIHLQLQMPPSLGPSSLEILQPHFSTLRKIDLRNRPNDFVICPLAQEILSSCPVLEDFRSTQIQATTIAEGRPWVCLRLQELHLDIWFNPNTIHDTQPHVLDNLSKLTRLRSLTVWSDPMYRNMDRNERVAMDLRLKYGLGKLSTLRSLEYISWGRSEQWMGEHECQWILDHWKSMWIVSGKFNALAPQMDELLLNRFHERGIVTFDPIRRCRRRAG
ncbi:hypothetical protein BGX31_010401 [Mortierella sp. GBA43]|nr:hypothetical protein BGX31_010401 [Mortierella sp. GBA43]